MITVAHLDLKARWVALQAEHPHTYIRNAAASLGVSEADLLSTRLGAGVVRLNPDAKAILADVPLLGHVTALTRNDHVVHERQGTYRNPQLEHGPVGLFVGTDIDLRIFWHQWAMAFAVEEQSRDGVRQSLQFFGPDGQAVHKVYLTDTSDVMAYKALVLKHRADAQEPVTTVAPTAPTRPELPDDSIDVEAFRSGWLGLKDTHDFHLLLRDHRVSRTQALRLAPPDGYAVPVEGTALRSALTLTAERQIPIMVFVGNPGMIQIHTGPVVNVVDARGWFNVLDPHFNLHIREEAITQVWVIRKPTADGLVTALECFDDKGEQLIQLFGARKPGIPELETWRELVGELERQHAR